MLCSGCSGLGQALGISGVELVKGVCGRFVVVHGRTFRHGALVCGMPDARPRLFKENRTVVAFGRRQDAQDGQRAVECHSGQDGRGRSRAIARRAAARSAASSSSVEEINTRTR